MRFAAIILALAVAARASAGGLAGAAAAASDWARLQGLWHSYWLQPGQELPRNPGDGDYLRISGNQARYMERGVKSRGPASEVSFTLDPRQTPKAIDVRVTENGRTGTYKGIYALKDGEVRVAFAVKLPTPADESWGAAKERPASFDHRKLPKDIALLVLVLKPAKGEPPAADDAKTPPLLSLASDPLGGVALSPDGRCLALTVAPWGGVRLWDTVTGKELATLRGLDSAVRTVVFSRDGKRLFTATAREVRVWAVPTGKPLQRIPAGLGQGADRLAWSAGEKWFAYAPDTEPEIKPASRFLISTVHLWDVGAGKEVRRLEITRTMGQMVGQSFDYFITGKGSDAIVGTALSQDGKWVAVGTEHGEVHVWSAATGKKVRTVGGWSDVGAMPLGFSGDGKRLVTSSLTLLRPKIRRFVRVWDVATGKEKQAIEGKASAPNDPGKHELEPSLTDDGKWLIWSTADDTTVRIWDVETGKEVRAFAGHKKAVLHAWVSGDRKLLAAYDEGGSVRLWDVATGKELRAFDVLTGPDRLHAGVDFRARASRDLKVLAVWSPRRVTLWDLEKGKAIRSLRR